MAGPGAGCDGLFKAIVKVGVQVIGIPGPWDSDSCGDDDDGDGLGDAADAFGSFAPGTLVLRTPDNSGTAVVIGGWHPSQSTGTMWDLTIPGNNDHDFYIVLATATILVRNCGGPKSSKQFISPTNPPQLPPTDLPPGYSVRVMGPTPDYPDGYWRITNSGGQYVSMSIPLQ
jgi:hypothetical protein